MFRQSLTSFYWIFRSISAFFFSSGLARHGIKFAGFDGFFDDGLNDPIK
jgi:hypothetical protein